jgi:hypothetical protein
MGTVKWSSWTGRYRRIGSSCNMFLLTFTSGCSEYNRLKATRLIERSRFSASNRRANHGAVLVPFPPHLLGPFPPFIAWLNGEVARLRQADFSTPIEVANLSCGPAPIAWSFHSMWAYGAHYRCNEEEEGASHVTLTLA